MADLNSEAIDFRATSESFKPTRTHPKRNLETLRLLTTHQGHLVPAVGGALLYGRDRKCHFPYALVQAGRFDFIDKSRTLGRPSSVSFTHSA
jgi:ATP-dependent DNA helicase RecG